MKTRIGFRRLRDMVINATHHNCVAATAFETGVGLTSLNDGQVFQSRVSRCRLNLMAPLAVNLCREDVAGRADEPSQLQSVLSFSRADVRDATALANPEERGKSRGLAANAGRTDARDDKPADSRDSRHEN